MEKLQAPKAYCTSCGAAYRSEGGICHRTVGGRYDCKGIIRLASNPSYWRTCAWCNGSGGYAAQTCHSCHGDGWVLAGSPDWIRGTTPNHARHVVGKHPLSGDRRPAPANK
jgi:hypothetical protein